MLSILVGLGTSGTNSRDYRVLEDTTKITLGTEKLSVRQVIEKYKPKIYESLQKRTVNPLFIWYEAILDKDKDRIILVYRPTWKDEENVDSPFIDNLYRIYRTLYYGNPPIDSEYIEIVLELPTSKEVLARFEVPKKNYSYTETTQPHYTAKLTKTGQTRYEMNVLDADKKLIHQAHLDVQNLRELKLASVTWNHLFWPIDKGDATKFEKFADTSMELKRFTEQEYKKHRFARRSQGSYSRRIGFKEAIPNIVVVLMGLFLIEKAIPFVLRSSK